MEDSDCLLAQHTLASRQTMVPWHQCLSLACSCNSGGGGAGDSALALLASLILWCNNGIGGRVGDSG